MPTPLRVATIHAPQADVIECLRDALERAERGEIRAVAIAAQATPNKTSATYSLGDGDRAHLVRALEDMKMRPLGFGG